MAVITGGTDGIGKAIAIAFAKDGAKIIMVARDERKGQTTLEEVRRFGEVVYFKGDVSDSSQVRGMVEETIRKYGRIDILVNNAALCPSR